MKYIKWFLFNATVFGLVVWGLVYDNEGINNVAHFLAWSLMIISLLTYINVTNSKEFLEKLANDNKGSVHIGLIVAVNLSITLLFIWYGSFLTGIAYLVNTFFIAATKGVIKKYISENGNEQA